MISFRSGKRRSGVNFTDVLRTAFTLIDPKSAKTTVKLSVILQIGDLRAEMLSVNMLVKLTPGYFFYFFRKQLSDKKVWLFFEQTAHDTVQITVPIIVRHVLQEKEIPSVSWIQTKPDDFVFLLASLNTSNIYNSSRQFAEIDLILKPNRSVQSNLV